MMRLKLWVASRAGWRRALAAALLGAAATAALPPLHLLPLDVVAFTGLVWLIDAARGPRAAFAAGWWFGFGYFTSGLYWFAYALLTDAARFGWLIPFAVFGISGLLAVFPALAAAAARLCPRGVARALGLALAWVAAEWLRGRVLSGFPWNLVGSGWTVSETMIQVAALAGVWGLSFVTVLAGALPATLAEDVPGPRRWLPTAVGTLILAAVFAGGALRLAGAEPDVVDGVRLRLVQPNIAQHHKWRPELRKAFLERHLEMTTARSLDGVSAVIWPETAIPYFIANDPALRRLVATAAPPGGVLLSGAIRTTPEPSTPGKLWNSLHAIDSRGAVVATYDKFHLVPFGEYVPFRRLLPLEKLTYGSVDFSAGRGPRTLHIPGLPAVSPLICYEAIFPHRVLDRADRPRWLLNITNDAWFGMSSGPYQHFASARLRAVEQGLPLVRVANTGISGVVDAYGRVTARLGLDRAGTLDATLPEALDSLTPYARWGDGTLLAILVVGIVYLGWWTLGYRRTIRKSI
ncbi:MAG: apolipoprotein N-acyltransferase [Alphaproteobacteria bacterium]